MNISHVAASRPRSGESRAFSGEHVSNKTESEASANPPASSYAWIRPLRTRVLSGKTRLGKSAKFVLVTLLEHVDPDGRTWVGVETIADDASFGSAQTVRNALQALEKAGWLLIVPQTWTTLTNEQIAVGRKTPRRGDVGQAPNLYLVLDGNGNPACGQARPGLARVSPSNSSPANSQITPPQNLEGSLPQKQEGEPLSKLIGDLAPSEDRSMNESVEHVASDPSTHNFSKCPKTEEGGSEAWNVIVEVHAEKTKAVYGLPPLPPDLKRDQRQALAACLDGAATEVRAKLHARTSTACEFGQVRRDLAARVMQLYFKRDNEHLRRVKHALRDLPREFHARITEAMQALLRESHEAAPPRRTTLDAPHERNVSVDKPAEIEPQERHKEPELVPVDKPREAASSNTAVEAKRLLEALNAQPQRSETPKFERPTIPAISRQSGTGTDGARADKPTQDRPVQDKPASNIAISFEQKRFEDKPAQDKPSPKFERPLGRSGAPRWGSIGPRPTKVREVKKLTTDEVDLDEEHGGGSTPTR